MTTGGFIFGAPGLPKTPQELARLRAVAESLAVRNTSAPKNIGEGLSAIGNALAYRSMMGDIEKAQKAGADSVAADLSPIANMLLGGSGALAPRSGAAVGPSATGAASPSAVSNIVDALKATGAANLADGTAPVPTTEPIPQAEPAPVGALTPQQRIDQAFGATPNDRAIATRTVLGEAANEGQTGMQAVANVIANRARDGKYGGTSMAEVSRAPNQFEPWNTAGGRNRMMSYAQASVPYQAAQEAVDNAGVGSQPDITGGARYFYAPQAQQQLAAVDGRPVVPSFAQQPPTAVIGGHNFYAERRAPQQHSAPQAPPTQVAQAQPQVSPQGNQKAAVVQQLLKAAQNPWLSQNPVMEAVVKSQLQQAIQEQDPTRQLDTELKREQLKKLQNPGTPESVRALEDRARLAGLQPGTREYQQFMTNGGRGPLVNIDQKSESEYDKQMAKQFADANMEIMKAAGNARGKIATLDRLGTLLKDPNIYTGAGGQGVLELKRLGKAIGIGVGDVGPAEAAKSISNQFALELRNPSGGAGMPGALSDKDREFLQSMVPSLGQNPQGNTLIIDYMKRVAQRSIDVERLRQQYIRKNGRLNEGFYNELADWSDANPLFTEDDLKKAAVAPQQQTGPSIDDLLRKYGGK